MKAAANKISDRLASALLTAPEDLGAKDLVSEEPRKSPNTPMAAPAENRFWEVLPTDEWERAS
jgi:hypothetical protein